MSAESRAVGKFLRRMMPLLVLMLLVNNLDRTNVGFIQEDLQADVGVSATAYGFGAGLFFIGYALFEVPSNMLLERFGARVWLTRIMITWGLVIVSMCFIHNVTTFYVLRFLLGVAEAGFFPGAMLYITQWLPDSSRGRATAIFLGGSAAAGIVTGPITGALLELHGAAWHRGLALDVRPGGRLLGGRRYRRGLLPGLPDRGRALARRRREGGAAGRGRRGPAGPQPRAQGVPVQAVDPPAGPAADRRLLRHDPHRLRDHLLAAEPDRGDRRIVLLPGRRPVGDPRGLLHDRHVLHEPLHRPRPGPSPLPCRHARPVRRMGTYLATLGNPWFGLVAITLAGVGSKCAATLFWPMAQSGLDLRIAAPGLALVNSIGNLGGFVSPFLFGYLKDTTGSTNGGLYTLTAASLLAVIAVKYLRSPRATVDLKESTGSHSPLPR